MDNDQAFEENAESFISKFMEFSGCERKGTFALGFWGQIVDDEKVTAEHGITVNCTGPELEAAFLLMCTALAKSSSKRRGIPVGESLGILSCALTAYSDEFVVQQIMREVDATIRKSEAMKANEKSGHSHH